VARGFVAQGSSCFNHTTFAGIKAAGLLKNGFITVFRLVRLPAQKSFQGSDQPGMGCRLTFVVGIVQ